MGKKLRFILWLIIVIAIVLLIGTSIYNIVMAKTEKVSHPEVTFELENYGNIKIELYPEYAPNTVANFIKLVEKGYYNDKVIYGKDEVCLYVGRNQGIRKFPRRKYLCRPPRVYHSLSWRLLFCHPRHIGTQPISGNCELFQSGRRRIHRMPRYHCDQHLIAHSKPPIG